MGNEFFVVMLRADGFIAQLQAIGKPDGVQDGQPFWLCSEVDTAHPYYLRVVPAPLPNPAPAQASRTTAARHIPHSEVLCIWEAKRSDDLPVGFRAGGR